MILIAGPPGAGKTLQAKLLEKSHNIKWLSMGKLLRDSADDELNKILMSGKLVPDELAQQVLKKAVSDVPISTRVLIDGYPRNDTQVDWFLNYIKDMPRELEKIVHIVVPLEVSKQRLKARSRADDTEEAIKERFEVYLNHVLPMITHFAKHISSERVVEINGEQSIEEVNADIVKSLEGIIDAPDQN